MSNEHLGGGVVDPSILDTELDTSIPDSLRNQGQAQPVFTTAVNPEGQTEVVVEEQPIDLEADAAAYHADQPTDVAAQQVIDALPEQVTVETSSLTASEGESEELAHSQPPAEEPTNDAPPSIGHNQPADPAEMRRDFFKDINKFGKASGEGASALGRLGLRSLRAAADGVISTAKPQGGGKDDATLIYEAYAAMDSKHSEHTAGGAKANASKLRQIIGMGCMTTLADPVAVGDRVVRIREEMEGAELKPKALFAALVDVAREQQASDTELSDAAIRECLTKTKAEKTLEKEWQAIAKKVEGLVTGEASHGLKDNSDVALKIAELVDERLKQYKSDETRADLIETMMEKGYTHAQAVAIVDKKL